MITFLLNKHICDQQKKLKGSIKSKLLICSLLNLLHRNIHLMMTGQNLSLHKILYVRLLTSCVLSAILGFIPAALAGYTPPKDQKPPSGYSDSSGVRGSCNVSSPIQLAPKTHVGRTTSTHPTFAWIVPDQEPVTIKFSLYEFDRQLKPKKLDMYTQTFTSSPGLMQQSLPMKSPGLTVGKRYLWQLQTLCNLNSPSHNPIARAEIEVVSIPQTLVNQLSTVHDSSIKAHLYGKYGVWYDAIKEVLPSSNDEEFNSTLNTLLASLVEAEKPSEHKDDNQIALIINQ